MITAKDLPCWVTDHEGGPADAWATMIDGCGLAMLWVQADRGISSWERDENLFVADSPPPGIDPDVYDEWAEQLPEAILPPAPERKIQRGDLVEGGSWDIPFTVVSQRDDGVSLIDSEDGFHFVTPVGNLTYVGPGDPAVLARWSL